MLVRKTKPIRKRARPPGLCVAAVGLLAVLAAPGVQGAPYPVRVGYVANGSFGEAAEKDTATALNMWSKELFSVDKSGIAPRAVGFARPTELAAATLAGTISVMVLDTYHFITLKQCATLTPSLVSLTGGSPTVTYVLLVRRKDGVRSLSQLAGRVMVVGNRTSEILPLVWLDTALRQNGLRASSAFFRSARVDASPNEAMLAVFFGKAGACIVTSRALASAAELNPQLGQQLKVLKTSGHYQEKVVCIGPRVPPNVVKAVHDSALTLHRKPRGRQVLALFGIEKIVPHKPAFMQETKKLVSTYKALGGRPR